MCASHFILPNMTFETFCTSITSAALRAVAEHWDAARGDRMMPSWQQLKPSRIAAQLPIVWVYKYNRETQEFTGRLAGDRITRHYGKSFRGIKLEDIHLPDALADVYGVMNRIVEQPALFSSRGTLFRQRDRTGTGERIILPLAGDTVHCDGLIGASDYQYALANPDYGPVELLAEDERWFALGPEQVAA